MDAAKIVGWLRTHRPVDSPPRLTRHDQPSLRNPRRGVILSGARLGPRERVSARGVSRAKDPLFAKHLLGPPEPPASGGCLGPRYSLGSGPNVSTTVPLAYG